VTDSDKVSKVDPALAQQILDYVFHPEYQPVKPKGIHRALGLPPDDYPAVRKAVKRLVLEGKLAYATNHLVLSPEQLSGHAKLIRGTFRQAAAGFGFVRPQPTGKVSNVEDIFIPAPVTGSAMEGDLVAVRVRSSRRGGQEGEVVEIVQRARRQFAGTYIVEQGQSLVMLDGVVGSGPVEVGDVRGLPVEPGDKVVVELVKFPDRTSGGEAVIMEVLGSSKNPAIDTLAVMRQFGLEEEFPEAVIEFARRQADAFVEGDIPAGRRDLTHVPTLTIDPYDARDFDDAISLCRNERGHWELWVHIADVAHFVPLGSVLDDEAKQRATSVYLPDRVIPMLPELISNHLASLQPHKVRLTKTVHMEMTDNGTIVHQEVFNSAIHNDQRLNYEQVDMILRNPEDWRTRLSPEIFQLLRDMHTLAMVLRGNRTRAGALELHLPEVKIDLDKSGKVKGARLMENTESHQIIEEFMLAANQAVATWLDDLEIPFLRRAHAPPERRRLQKLNDFVRDLGIKCESLESRYEIQRVISLVRGKPTEYAVNYAILKSMSKAVYQPELEMHYALHFDHYCHFTSPIRRYPDLQVHRTVERLIQERRPFGDPLPVLITLGQHCSDKEQNAEFAERETIKIKILHFLKKKIGETLQGVISGVTPEGFYVRGTQFPAEGFVPIRSLPDDRYRYEKQGQMLEGFREGNRFRLGDSVTVKIHEVDLARRSLLFALEANHTSSAAEHRNRISKASSTKGKDKGTGSAKSKGKKIVAKKKKRRRK
jgi:ribonuclease R